MSRTRLSKVTITPRGAWDAKAEYKRLDAVSNGGASWLAKRDNTGITPVEGDDWMMLTQKQIDDGAVELSTTWSSKNIIDRLCPEVTATGNPVVLEDVVEGYPMDVTASWDVQQEGKGEPHLAGYGTNLFRLFSEDKTVTSNGLTVEYTAETETLHISGTNTKTDTIWNLLNCPNDIGTILDFLKAGKTFTISWNAGTTGIYAGIYCNVLANAETGESKSVKSVCWLSGDKSSLSFTIPDDFLSFYAFTISVSGTCTTVDVSFRIQIEEGSTATTWSKYAANIRPFVDRDSVTIQQNGKNIFKNPFESGSKWTNTTQYGWGGAWAEEGDMPDMTKAKGRIVTYQVYFDATQTTEGENYTGIWTRKNYVTLSCLGYGNRIEHGSFGISSVTCTIPKDVDFDTIGFGVCVNAKNGTVTAKNSMVEFNSTMTDFEPYQEHEETVILPQTTYGGSLTQDGKLTNKYLLIHLDGKTELTNTNGKTWETWGVNARSDWLTGFFLYQCFSKIVSMTGALCSHLITPANTWGGQALGAGVFASTTEDNLNTQYVGVVVPTSILADVSSKDAAVQSFKDWLAAQNEAGTPVTLCARLAYDETAQANSVSYSALSGVSTLITDADSLTVTARADPIKTITNLTNRVAALEAAATNIEEV